MPTKLLWGNICLTCQLTLKTNACIKIPADILHENVRTTWNIRAKWKKMYDPTPNQPMASAEINVKFSTLTGAHEYDPKRHNRIDVDEWWMITRVESQTRFNQCGDTQWSIPADLTHWGRVTHICVSEIIIIGSDNGLSPDRRQAIIWTSDGIFVVGPLGINFSEVLIEINKFSFNKMHLKMLSAKWRLFRLGLNVLRWTRGWGSRRHQPPLPERWDNVPHLSKWYMDNSTIFAIDCSKLFPARHLYKQPCKNLSAGAPQALIGRKPNNSLKYFAHRFLIILSSHSGESYIHPLMANMKKIWLFF